MSPLPPLTTGLVRDPSQPNCPVSYCLSLIGGKWKPVIIFLVSAQVNRFGALTRSLPTISKHILAKQLKELEMDGILLRIEKQKKPAIVEYFLTPRGQSLLPIIQKMREWGEDNLAITVPKNTQ